MAVLAIVVGLWAGEYVAAMLIALMVSSGRTLEEYGVSRAKRSLTALVDRIPSEVLLWNGAPETDASSAGASLRHHLAGEPGARVQVTDVAVGQYVYVRKGEVISLD